VRNLLRRPFVIVACATLPLAVAAGCGKKNESSGSGVKGDTLQIGAALSLTGSLAKEGGLTKQGYQLCQSKVNDAGGVKVGDKKLKLAISFSDDKSEPDTAAQLIDKFNDSGKKLILGPYGSPSTEAAAAAIERNGQVMADSSGADDNIFTKGYKTTFAVLSPASQYVATMIKAINAGANPKPKTVAMLSADDGFSQTAAKGGVAEAKKAGMQVVAQESFPEKTTDVSSALTKVKGKNPELILGSVHVEEGIAIIKQAGELQVKPAGGFGETVAPPTPDFQKALGAKAEYHSAEAAAACLAIDQAVEKAGSTDPKKVRDALAALDIESFFGPIKFNDRGQNVSKPMSAIQIQNGEVVTVYPKDQQQAPLQWPAK
jgi:branched-chain amino acid transport system substrate-binding protein